MNEKEKYKKNGNQPAGKGGELEKKVYEVDTSRVFVRISFNSVPAYSA